MITLLRSWKGVIEVDGIEYDSVADAEEAIKSLSDDMRIVLKAHKSVEEPEKQKLQPVSDEVEYLITVKPYMTKKATIDFDFMRKWNNDIPMPLRTMSGTVDKETRGMIHMKLHGIAQETVTCMCCGRELTHPVSRHYGIGPVCMEKVGIYCDIDNIDEIKEKLVDVTWEGWIIKSAIIEREEV